MTAQERLDAALKAVDAAHTAHAAHADEERKAQVSVRAQRDHFASDRASVNEAESDINRRALAGDDVTTALASIAERRAAVDYFTSRVLPKLEAFSLAPLAEESARLHYELQAAILAAEQARLAVHEQAVARAIRQLVEVTANAGITVGGGDRESTARNNGDLRGARHRDIIADQLAATERAKTAWTEAQERTLRLQRAYLEKFGNG